MSPETINRTITSVIIDKLQGIIKSPDTTRATRVHLLDILNNLHDHTTILKTAQTLGISIPENQSPAPEVTPPYQARKTNLPLDLHAGKRARDKAVIYDGKQFLITPKMHRVLQLLIFENPAATPEQVARHLYPGEPYLEEVLPTTRKNITDLRHAFAQHEIPFTIAFGDDRKYRIVPCEHPQS